MRSIPLKFLILPGLLVMGIVLLLATQPAAARVRLQAPDGGSAVWFFRSCDDFQGKEVAGWRVAPDPADPRRQTLLVAVQTAYPGDRLTCDIHLANDGSVAIDLGSALPGIEQRSDELAGGRGDPFAKQVFRTLRRSGHRRA